LIQGIILDTIAWHSPAFDGEELKLENQLTRAPVQELWQQLQQPLGQSARYEDSEFAFSLAIAAGRAADEGPAEDNPEAHRSIYGEYKKLIDWDRRGDGASSAKRPKMNRQLSETSLQVDARMYVANQQRAMRNRRCFLTSTGYLGIGHRALGVGDRCVVAKGANVPFILQEAAPDGASGTDPNRWRLIGESYIQGVMRGTMIDRRSDGAGSPTHGHMEERLAIE
jgi:hypothetical protein